MVLRPLPLRAALAAATALTAGLVTTPAAVAAEPDPSLDPRTYGVPESYDAPLLVTIDDLTPGEVPGGGPIRIKGTVVNRDVETWTGISVYPFINGDDCDGCPPPITTRAGLVEAAETDPTTVVGNRIVEVSATIEELSPGEVRPYTIRVPRRLLAVSTPGVYWFGVHALGESESAADGDVASADGRARTFLPYLPRGRDGVRGQVDAAIVVPLRHRVRHLQNGRLARPQEWEDAFESDGELGAPLDFGRAAVGKPVTWLIDPAVLDAARLLRRGNPPRDIGPEETDGGDAGNEEPTQDEGGGAGEGGEGGEEGDETAVAENDPVAKAADEWLSALEGQVRAEEVLALPYGDLDMSATPDRMPGFYPLARERASEVLSTWSTQSTPVVSSPGGYLDPSAMDGIDDDSTLLLTDRMYDPESFPNGPPVVGEYDGHTVAATSYGAATGGPGPEPRLSAVAFRQRVLSEAAIRMISPGRRHPLIVMVPRSIDSHAGATFWAGLEASWLNLTTVADATDRDAVEVDPDTLSYPVDQETAELSSQVFSEAEMLVDAGAVLQNLLTNAGTVAADTRAEALTAASYHSRADPAVAASRLERSRSWIERRLRRIGIDGPEGVTLSSADGSFAVAVTNPLDRTVTVRIAAASVDGEVDVDVGEPIVLAADSRTTIQLDAHSRGTGVHNVTLSVTDVDGTPLGSSVEVPIRSGQVSEVIWVIIGTGVGMLFVAIALRLFRRIRNHRREAAA